MSMQKSNKRCNEILCSLGEVGWISMLIADWQEDRGGVD